MATKFVLVARNTVEFFFRLYQGSIPVLAYMQFKIFETFSGITSRKLLKYTTVDVQKGRFAIYLIAIEL